MRYIFLSDNPVFSSSFRNSLKKTDAYAMIRHGAKGFLLLQGSKSGMPASRPRKSLLEVHQPHSKDRFLIHYNNKKYFAGALKYLLSQKAGFQGLVIVNALEEGFEIKDPRLSRVTVEELMGKSLNFRWEYLSALGKAQRLKNILEPAKKLLILMQHDPDPDALASALALRTLLNRTRATATIGTFGKITWSENQAMARLLDIDVVRVDKRSLRRFDKIALVDVQPPYFEGVHEKYDAVIDHHPLTMKERVPFMDVRPSYGATATILTEYLVASNIPINQRLATALLYGLKTDTLFLGREVCAQDFEAFKYVWPLANHNILRKMERPELGTDEIISFIHALAHREKFGRVLYTFLGEVGREDIIPRLADFCLQIAEVDWSLVCGIHSGNIIISARNVGVQKSAGSLLFQLFGEIGKAGGHASMAKAVIPLKRFKKVHGRYSLRKISRQILEIFQQELENKQIAGG